MNEHPYQPSLLVRGDIRLLSAFHVGSGQASILSDMAVQRDRQGRPYLPGSSLAGLLRSAAEDLSEYVLGQPGCDTRDHEEGCPTCSLFGFAPQREGGDGRGGAASRLSVEDAFLTTDFLAHQEVREHVGINRQRGAAEPKLQFSQEVAPGGAQFAFEISIEAPDSDDLRLITAVLDLWQRYGFQFGGRSTTGLGWAKLENLKCYRVDLSDEETLQAYLFAREEFTPPAKALVPRQELLSSFGAAEGGESGEGAGRAEYLLPQHLYVDIALEFLEPVLVVGNLPKISGQLSDAEFIQTRLAGGQETYFIPGSSLKGVLRSRVEKILRTLNEAQACDVTQAKAKEGWNIKLACFGDPNQQRQAQENNYGAKEIYEESCLACRIFGNSMMRGRMSVGEALPVEGAEMKAKLFDHVAIDRFGGGAAEAKKFNTRPLMPGKPKETLFRFQLHLERPEPWMWGLLALALKDLCDGDLHIGHATHRGFGRVKGHVESITALILPGTQWAEVCQEAGFDLPEQPQIGPYYELALELPKQNDGSAQAGLLVRCHQDFLEQAASNSDGGEA